MAGSRSWTVESKEFELLIKGGASGVRIFKRSKRKQRSIFLKRDEIVWLVGTVKEVVAEETSEVFWDQSRARYPRITAQKCSNRHKHFLTLEEFDGRSGAILIPKGGYGQGWVHFISEVRVANEALNEVRKVRGVKKAKAVRGRSYAKALGLSSNSEEECFNSYIELIARVPRWLKEATAEIGLQASSSPRVGQMCDGPNG
jgi:hypothetical protein